MDKKLISAVIGTTLIASGGAYTLQEQQINSLETELATLEVSLDDAKAGKQAVIAEYNRVRADKQDLVEMYLYSQISSGRVPTITPVISLNEVEQAYLDVVGEVNLSDTDLFKKGKEEAIKRGDFICP